MKFRLEINCDNAAFYNPDGKHDPCAEVASILEGLAQDLRDGSESPKRLLDSNGNTVGHAEFKRIGRPPKSA